MKKLLLGIGAFFSIGLALTGLFSIAYPPEGDSVVPYFMITIVFTALSVLLIRKIKGPPKEKEPYKYQEWKPPANSLQAKVDYVMSQTELPIVQNIRGIILKSGEVCHYQSDAYVLVIKNEVVGRTAGYRGASIRVAKGLTLHTGGSRGHSIRQDVPYTYPGVFTMTNKRFVMTGEKAFEYPLDKLTYFNDYDGGKGLVMQFGRSSFTVLMNEPYWVPKIIDLLRIQANSQSAQ